jgi:hypothetical protein
VRFALRWQQHVEALQSFRAGAHQCGHVGVVGQLLRLPAEIFVTGLSRLRDSQGQPDVSKQKRGVADKSPPALDAPRLEEIVSK